MFSSGKTSVSPNSEIGNERPNPQQRPSSFLFCAKFRIFLCAFIPLLISLSSVQSMAQTGVTTWHYDNARTSANTRETVLTPTKVNSSTFGKLATLPVDGFVVANPLYLLGVNVLNKGVHNVVYVVTMHDSVYAFDADSTNVSPLWVTSILNYSPAGATPVPASVKKATTTTGWSEVGIVSTPVIDPATIEHCIL